MSQELFFAVTAWFFISFCLGVYEHLPDLRHTFATLALQTGADVKTVSSMLGHYSAGFTLDTYTHVTNHMQLQAADKMGSFMDTALPETAPTPPEPPENSGCKLILFAEAI